MGRLLLSEDVLEVMVRGGEGTVWALQEARSLREGLLLGARQLLRSCVPQLTVLMGRVTLLAPHRFIGLAVTVLTDFDVIGVVDFLILRSRILLQEVGSRLVLIEPRADLPE